MTKPRKTAASKPAGGKAPAATTRRSGAQSGQSPRAAGPTLAGELKVGDSIYPPIPGAQAGMVVEQIAPVSIGGRDRVRVRFYGPSSGLRTTMMLNADEPVRTEPVA